MTEEKHALEQPTWTHTTDGAMRRVGVELEMQGLTIDELTQIVADHLQLHVDEESRYERRLTGDAAGDWGVELDSQLVKKMGRERRPNAGIADDLGESVDEVLGWLAENLVPLELVSPPLPLERLPEVETLIKTLRHAGATGTSDRLLNAFGMQFNPELPDTSVDVVCAYLKAFLCLYDWLYEGAAVNLSRQVTFYVDPFPRDYVRHVVNPAYQPDLATLIDDYLQANPTRNRALDMLPLFLHLDEDRVRAVTDDPLIKARPALHYRLPNCEIDQAGWGMHEAWNDWIQVEKLAADTGRLQHCCAAYHRFMKRPMQRWFGDWKKELRRRWLVPSSP